MAKKKKQTSSSTFKYEHVGLVPTSLPTISPRKMVKPGQIIESEVEIDNKLFKKVK